MFTTQEGKIILFYLKQFIFLKKIIDKNKKIHYFLIMKRTQPVKIVGSVVTKLTTQQLLEFGFTQAEIDSGEIKGNFKTSGPWHFPVSYRALCCSTVWDKDNYGLSIVKEKTFYGVRTLSNIRAAGYASEGFVSIKNKKYSAFTSGELIELENGRLVNIATIHVRMN